MRVIACLAEGLGIRGTARVFEIDPNTVLSWLVQAAEQLKTFSTYFLHELHLNQIQLDELYAVLSAVRDGDINAAEAIERLLRSPHWVWTAIDPESKLLLSVQVGERTLAMAQVERLNLSLRQRVAAIGRRSATPCRAQMGCVNNWSCSRSITTSCYLTPVCARCWLSPFQPMAMAQPRCGGPVRPRWRQD